jgi:hypothetical protein
MSTSGSTNFTLNARELITRAFRQAKIISAGENPKASESDDALKTLNLLLKTWATKERLWIREERAVTLIAATDSYAMSDARRVESVRRRTNGIDTPLNLLNRVDYDLLPNKAGSGIPVSAWFDPQRSTRRLYVWPVPTAAIAANTTLRVTVRRVIEDIDTLDDDFDMPQEWLEALSFSLAYRLGAEYGSDVLAYLKDTSESLVKDLEAQDQDMESLFLQVDYHA